MLRNILLLLSLTVVWAPALTGCDKRGDSSSQETDEATRASSEESGQAWQRVSESELDQQGRGMLAEARSAQKKLGSSLKEALTGAVEESSFDGAVDFCQKQAPALAREVSDEAGVEIGRTSHKLRNPDNAPPTWAEDVVESQQKGKYVFRGPKGKLGYLHPIELGGLCVNCHGPEEKLAPDVKEMLTKHYPKDEATGFEVGDLRGWFWVEVPPPS